MAMFGDTFTGGNLGAAQQLLKSRGGNMGAGGGKGPMGNMGQVLPPPSGYSSQISGSPDVGPTMQTQQAFTGTPTGDGGMQGQLAPQSSGGYGMANAPFAPNAPGFSQPTPTASTGGFGMAGAPFPPNAPGMSQQGQRSMVTPNPRRMAAMLGAMRGMR